MDQDPIITRNSFFTPRRLAIGGAMAGGALALVGTFGHGDQPSMPDRTATTIEVEIDGQTLVRTTEVQAPGVVGESPCGPKVDIEEATERFKAEEEVIRPTETAAFYEAHPNAERGHSEFLDENFGEEFNTWTIDNMPIKQTEIADENEDDSLVREMRARSEFWISDQVILGQNHYCDIETGEVFQVENISEFQVGEQFWVIRYTEEKLKQMEADGVKMPKLALTAKDGNDVLLLLQRGPCDNPLLTKETPIKRSPRTPQTVPETPPTTTPETVTSTIPPKTDDDKLPVGDGTPAQQDPGTPDKPGVGPAEQQPQTDGYLPGETKPTNPPNSTTTAPQPTTTAPRPTTTTTQPTTATTSPQPTSTQPPVTAQPTTPTSAPQNQPRPQEP